MRENMIQINNNYLYISITIAKSIISLVTCDNKLKGQAGRSDITGI